VGYKRGMGQDEAERTPLEALARMPPRCRRLQHPCHGPHQLHEQQRCSIWKHGSSSKRGIGLRNIPRVVQTRCMSIRSVTETSRPSRSWSSDSEPVVDAGELLRSSSFSTQAVTCRPAAAKSPDSLRYDAGNQELDASLACSLPCSRSRMENGGACWQTRQL
jgi:hypothetical protein